MAVDMTVHILKARFCQQISVTDLPHTVTSCSAFKLKNIYRERIER